MCFETEYNEMLALSIGYLGVMKYLHSS